MDSALSGVANTIFPPLPLPSVNLPDTTDLPQSNFNNPSSQQPSSKKSSSFRGIFSLHKSNTQPPSKSKRQEPKPLEPKPREPKLLKLKQKKQKDQQKLKPDQQKESRRSLSAWLEDKKMQREQLRQFYKECRKNNPEEKEKTIFPGFPRRAGNKHAKSLRAKRPDISDPFNFNCMHTSGDEIYLNISRSSSQETLGSLNYEQIPQPLSNTSHSSSQETLGSLNYGHVFQPLSNGSRRSSREISLRDPFGIMDCGQIFEPFANIPRTPSQETFTSLDYGQIPQPLSHAEAERGLEETQVSEPVSFKTVEEFGVFMDKCFEKINPLTFDEEFGASTD